MSLSAEELFGDILICSNRPQAAFPDAPVVPYILPAGTDARTLTDVCKCVVRFAPIRMSKEQLGSIHSRNENIDVSALGSCVAFYRRLLELYR